MDRVGEPQADRDRHDRVHKIVEHHPTALPAPDVVGDDRAEDRQDDERRGQSLQGPDDQVGQEVELRRDIHPADELRQIQADRHGQGRRTDHPDVKRDPAGPALRIVGDGRSVTAGSASAHLLASALALWCPLHSAMHPLRSERLAARE